MSSREEELRRQHEEDVRAWLGTEHGRRVFMWLMDGLCGTCGPSFTGNAPSTDFREGQRSIGIALMTEAQQVCPELYVLALQETLEARADEERRRREAATTNESEDHG